MAVKLFRLKEDEDVFIVHFTKNQGELMEFYKRTEEIKQFINKGFEYEGADSVVEGDQEQ